MGWMEGGLFTSFEGCSVDASSWQSEWNGEGLLYDVVLFGGQGNEERKS